MKIDLLDEEEAEEASEVEEEEGVDISSIRHW